MPDVQPDGRPWPRISIVTPSYNQGRFIEETIRSILLQGYPDIEYFVMDGGSTDDSVAILRKYDAWITKWVSEKDNGQSAAINKGMSLATGEWANWINSDDLLCVGALHALSVTSIEQSSQVDVISMHTLVVDERRRPLFEFTAAQIVDPRDFFERLDMPIPQTSTFVRRKLLKVEEHLNFAMDWALYLRLAAEGARFAAVAREGAIFRSHLASKTEMHSSSFEDEKIAVVASLASARVPFGKEMRDWLQIRESRRALRCSREELLSVIALVVSWPRLLVDRMFWGRLRRIAGGVPDDR